MHSAPVMKNKSWECRCAQNLVNSVQCSKARHHPLFRLASFCPRVPSQFLDRSVGCRVLGAVRCVKCGGSATAGTEICGSRIFLLQWLQFLILPLGRLFVVGWRGWW